jgi:hypothetical protein
MSRHDHESDWDWFPASPRTPDNDRDAGKAHAVAPLGVAGKAAIVLAASFCMALVVFVALAMFHNP